MNALLPSRFSLVAFWSMGLVLWTACAADRAPELAVGPDDQPLPDASVMDVTEGEDTTDPADADDPEGSTCNSNEDCPEGGACVGGICCNEPCEGPCMACNDQGECVLTPEDDPACGSISCAGLDTTCRQYDPLNSGRCAGFGQCAAPDGPQCTQSTPAPQGTVCSSADRCGVSLVCDGDGECVAAEGEVGLVWDAGPWGDCDELCGGGTRGRQVLCVNAQTEEIVDLACCEGQQRPETVEACNTHPCASPCGSTGLVKSWNGDGSVTCDNDDVITGVSLVSAPTSGACHCVNSNESGCSSVTLFETKCEGHHNEENVAPCTDGDNVDRKLSLVGNVRLSFEGNTYTVQVQATSIEGGEDVELCAW